MKEALAGITVLDVGGTVATGYCGKLFADHGARVINVEPAGGFETRRVPPLVAGEAPGNASAFHAWLSTNKASVARETFDKTRFRQLITSADAVLTAGENEISEHIHAASGAAVINEITWFGRSGPASGWRGSDAAVQSLAGLVKGIGKPDSAPLLPSGYQAQIVGGLTAFIASMTYVLAAEIGNREGPTWLDTSILEANLCFTEVGAVSASQTGYRGGRWGINRFPPTYPLGIYPCRDGWLGVTALTPSQWTSFCELIGLEAEAKEPRYQAVGERLADAERLDPIIAARLAEMSAADLLAQGQAMRIPLAPVPTMEELAGVDQYAERRAFIDIDLPGGKTVTGPATPFRLYATPARVGRVAGTGADTDDVMKALGK